MRTTWTPTVLEQDEGWTRKDYTRSQRCLWLGVHVSGRPGIFFRVKNSCVRACDAAQEKEPKTGAGCQVFTANGERTICLLLKFFGFGKEMQ